MNDFQNDLNQMVQRFVAQITEIARRAALDTLESAFGGKASQRVGMAVAGRAGRRAAWRGVKRSPADLQALSKKFIAFVKANPGLRIEQINKQLGTTTRDLARPIRKLIAKKLIVVKGQKRSTMYLPGNKA